MPIYEYQCLKCGALTEVILKSADEPPTTCEECGGELRKRLSAPAFQFKGTGWYVTDYARKKTSEAGSTAGTAGDGGGSDSGAKAAPAKETKATPAAKESSD